MCGCEFRYIPELGGWVPYRRETMETTVPGIYIAGDVSGIEEASTAIMTGAIAGLSVAEKPGYLDPEKSKALRQEKTEGLVPFRCKYFVYRHKANLRLMEMGGVVQ